MPVSTVMLPRELMGTGEFLMRSAIVCVNWA